MFDPRQTKPHDRNTPMNTFQAVLLQSQSSYLPRCHAVHFGDHQGQMISVADGDQPTHQRVEDTVSAGVRVGQRADYRTGLSVFGEVADVDRTAKEPALSDSG